MKTIIALFLMTAPLWAAEAQRCDERQFQIICYDKAGSRVFTYDRKRTITYPTTRRKYLSPREQEEIKKLLTQQRAK